MVLRGGLTNEDKRVISESLKETWPGLLLTLGFWGLAWLTGGNFSLIIVVIIVGMVSYDAYKVTTGSESRDGLRLIKKCTIAFAFLYGIVWLNFFLGGYGLLGFLLLVTFLSSMILYRKRRLYMRWVRHIETRFWGMTAEERKEERRKRT